MRWSHVLLLAVAAVVAGSACAQPVTRIQLVNAYSGGPVLDLVEGDTVLQRAVRYATEPTPLYVESTAPSGFVTYSIRSTGGVTPIATATFEITRGKQYSILAQGRADVNFPVELKLFEDNQLNECPIPEGVARYRFCHASQGVSKVNLIDANTDVLYAVDVLLDTCSDFFFLPAGVTRLQVVQSSIPTADPQEILPSTFQFTAENHIVNTLWLVGVLTEPAVSPLMLFRVSDAPCGAPVPFETVPLMKPAPVNEAVKIFGSDARQPFGQPIVYSDGVATLTASYDEYIEFEFPPPRSPAGKVNSGAVAMPAVVLALAATVFVLLA